ncbi:MAG: M28 family peptidase [Lysobacteraceae bacterium]
MTATAASSIRWSSPSPAQTLPDEIVVMGGHLDSISNVKRPGNPQNASARSPGADDDASGIAVMTEALRVAWAMAETQRTVKFMAYAAEEVASTARKAIA